MWHKLIRPLSPSFIRLNLIYLCFHYETRVVTAGDLAACVGLWGLGAPPCPCRAPAFSYFPLTAQTPTPELSIKLFQLLNITSNSPMWKNLRMSTVDIMEKAESGSGSRGRSPASARVSVNSFQPVTLLMIPDKKETFPWGRGALSFTKILGNSIKMYCLTESPSHYMRATE